MVPHDWHQDGKLIKRVHACAVSITGKCPKFLTSFAYTRQERHLKEKPLIGYNGPLR